MILLIDNYDSFTYNLAQYLGELGAEVQVFRNDAISLDEIEAMSPSHIVISPGPGVPDEAGISLNVIKHFAPKTPILGVCLGHQAIGQAFGGEVIRAEKIMHGKVSSIQHDGRGIFCGIPSPFIATRYHSLIVKDPLPDCLEVSAHTAEGVIMGLRHKEYPIVGVQFHPESILTDQGHQMLRNMLDIVKLRAAAVQVPVEKNGTASIKGAIAKLIGQQNLTEEEAETAMTLIMHGEASPAQIGSFITALRMKGETVAEITGCARAMRSSSVPVVPAKADDLVDTCGTGGDGAGTFNISTTAAFVVAGCGQPVAKHGNRSVSSKSGSADVLEALGVNLDLTPQQVADCIDRVGLGFLFAPKLHPAMKHAIGPRRELAVRTIFNILGPLTNPANANAQVLGVFDPDLTEPLAHVLGSLGSKAALVVHGSGGLDELTTSGPCRVSELRDGEVQTYQLDPESFGFTSAQFSDLVGGSAQENAVITRAILENEDQGARRDTVVLNAAAALMASGKAADLPDGIQLAQESIDSGAALRVLIDLVAFTNQ